MFLRIQHIDDHIHYICKDLVICDRFAEILIEHIISGNSIPHAL